MKARATHFTLLVFLVLHPACVSTLRNDDIHEDYIDIDEDEEKSVPSDIDEDDSSTKANRVELSSISTCELCLAAKGGWCIGKQICVPDVRGKCANPSDHIGTD